MSNFKIGDYAVIMVKIKAFDNPQFMGAQVVVEPLDRDKNLMLGEWIYIGEKALISTSEMSERVLARLGEK